VKPSARGPNTKKHEKKQAKSDRPTFLFFFFFKVPLAACGAGEEYQEKYGPHGLAAELLGAACGGLLALISLREIKPSSPGLSEKKKMRRRYFRILSDFSLFIGLSAFTGGFYPVIGRIIHPGVRVRHVTWTGFGAMVRLFKTGWQGADSAER
jgi:hypothetical protein